MARLAALLLLFLPGWTVEARAQIYTPTRTNTPDDYPPVLPRRRQALPPLALLTVAARPLPGYPVGPPRMGADGLWVPLAGEWVRIESHPEPRVVPVAAGPAPETPQASAAAEGSSWILHPSGRWRYRTRAEGRLEAQRWRRNRWRRAWSLRVPAATLAPPLVTEERIVFGALDNQVYAVRHDNGHRLWAADVGDRVSAPLALWRGYVGPAEPSQIVELVLVIPDGGGRLLALDAYDGRVVASSDPPEPDSRWRPPPVVFPDGRIVALLEPYAATGALAVFHEVVTRRATGGP